jgi:hypothetical protein
MGSIFLKTGLAKGKRSCAVNILAECEEPIKSAEDFLFEIGAYAHMSRGCRKMKILYCGSPLCIVNRNIDIFTILSAA